MVCGVTFRVTVRRLKLLTYENFSRGREGSTEQSTKSARESSNKPGERERVGTSGVAE